MIFNVIKLTWIQFDINSENFLFFDHTLYIRVFKIFLNPIRRNIWVI